jgi:hypothetical protein
MTRIIYNFIISENLKKPSSQLRGFNPVQHVEDLFNYIGLGTGRNIDPYLSKVNERCLTGDLAECFKSRALNYFSDFFDHAEYSLNDNIRIKRMSEQIVTEVHRQPYEYSNEPRYVITFRSTRKYMCACARLCVYLEKLFVHFLVA